jgi:hypothetical protein
MEIKKRILQQTLSCLDDSDRGNDPVRYASKSEGGVLSNALKVSKTNALKYGKRIQ